MMYSLNSSFFNLLRSEQFFSLINAQKNKGIKNEPGADFLGEFEIPLPSRDEQQAFVDEIDRQRAIIAGAEMILENWKVDTLLAIEGDLIPISKLAEVDAKIIKDLVTVSESTYVGGENIESGTGRITSLQTVVEAGIIGPSYSFKSGQIIYSKVRPNLRKCFLAEFDGICSSDIYPYSVISDKVLPQYLAMVFSSQRFADMTSHFHERAGMPKINREQLATISISIPPLEAQQDAVTRYLRERLFLNELRRTIDDAKKRSLLLINAIWEH